MECYVVIYYETFYVHGGIKCAELILITWRDPAVNALSYFRQTLSCLPVLYTRHKSFSMPQVIAAGALHAESWLVTRKYVWDVRYVKDLAAIPSLTKLLFLKSGVFEKTISTVLWKYIRSMLLFYFIALFYVLFCSNMKKAIAC